MANSASDHVIPRERWQPRTTMMWFERNRSVPVAKGVISLAHAQTVRILQGAHEVITRNTYFISFVARQILCDRISGKIYKEEEIFHAEQLIAQEFERIRDWLDGRLAQTRHRIELAGYDPANAPREFTKYEYPAATRVVTDFRQLLEKADEYLVLIHFLYLIGELSDTQITAEQARLGNERTVRGTVNGMARRSSEQFQVIARICKGAIQIKADARRDQAKRDEERAARKKAKKLAAQEALRAQQAEQDTLAQAAASEAPADGTPVQKQQVAAA